MNRIDKLFATKKKNVLSVFFTAGIPNIDDTAIIVKGLEQAGVAMVEIGIPFSDPVADGPVIQESNQLALSNGMTLKKLLQQVQGMRHEVAIPIVLMGYLNPVLQYGVEQFCFDCAKAGVDGLILPDLPLEVYEQEWQMPVTKAGLAMTFLIAPTSAPSRITKAAGLSTSFVYAVSASATTGAKNTFSGPQLAYFERIKGLPIGKPVMYGFGISNAETFNTACQFGAGAIVGSAFVRHLLANGTGGAGIKKFVEEIMG